MHPQNFLLLAFITFCPLTSATFAQKAEPAAAEKKPAEAAAEKPEQKKQPTKVKASGFFVSAKAVELSADTEKVTSLKIEKILPHGSKVKAGQAIIWFDTEAFERKLEDAEQAFQLAEIAFQEAQLSYEQHLATQQLDKALVQRTYQRAKQAYDNYQKTDRERAILATEYSLKSYQSMLENAQEELNQLEKMYKEDELTEESEEIVLKRARRAVESAEYQLAGAKIKAMKSLKQSIPLTEADQEDAFKRAQLVYDKGMRDLNWARQKKEIEFAKEKRKLADQKKALNELREDRKKMVIKSPLDGYLYLGKITKGKVSDKLAAITEGATVTNTQIIATAASSAVTQVEASLAEADIRHIKVGSKAIVKAAAFPDLKLTATVKALAEVPGVANKFACTLELKKSKDLALIVPGMSSTIEFSMSK